MFLFLVTPRQQSSTHCLSSAASYVYKRQEFDKPEWHFGFLNSDRLDADQIKMLADLPSMDGMRAKLLGTLQAPAAQLVRTLIEPSASLARIVRAKFGEEG